ncbi:MAG: gamma-mobile-trio protein GmtX [Devosia sp.]
MNRWATKVRSRSVICMITSLEAPMVNCHLVDRMGRVFVNGSTVSFGIRPLPGSAPFDDVDDDMAVRSFAGEQDHNVTAKLEAMIANATRQGRTARQRSADVVAFTKAAVRLKDKGEILFPLGFLWGQSALGRIPQTNLASIFVDLYPADVGLRERFEAMPQLQRMQQKSRRDYSFMFRKIYLTLRLSVQGINGFDDLQDSHMALLSEAFKPAGVWQPWIGEGGGKRFRAFASSISEERGDPFFGQAIGRIAYSGRGARLRSPLIDSPHLQWVDDEYERWLDEQFLMQKKSPRRGKTLLMEVLKGFDPETVTQPEQAFSRPVMTALLEYAATWSTPALRYYSLGKILDFGTWLSDRSRGDDGKLRNIHEVCRHLIVTGKQRLSVPSLLSTYAARFPAKDQAISESSVRNKRAGGNPYQELYRSWESASSVLLATSPRTGKTVGGEILGESDLVGLTDITLRHQVKLLIAQNRSYKSQLDILKKVVGHSSITIEATHPDTVLNGKGQLVFSESELSALADFLAPRRFQSRGLVEGDGGILQARGGKDLSDPGLLDGLRKVLKHLLS